jgi:hypothetical protein
VTAGQPAAEQTAAGPPAAGATRPTRRGLGITALVFAWVPLVLLADSAGSGVTYPVQCGLGVLTAGLLIALLRRESALVRAQILVVVIYATAIEFTFSGLLHTYDYRLHEVPFLARVPWFVPPGHGLVYLAALAAGRDPWVRRHGRLLVRGVLAVGGAYALWGLTLSARLDVLGAMWFCCLAWFLIRGRQPLVYVGAFVVVTWLELVGTGLGTWTWAAHSPTGVIPMGNPPADAAGGYGFFDAAALLVGPWLACQAAALATIWSRSVHRGRQPSAAVIRAGSATSSAGSPGRRPASATLRRVPVTRSTAASTSRLEKPDPTPTL